MHQLLGQDQHRHWAKQSFNNQDQQARELSNANEIANLSGDASVVSRDQHLSGDTSQAK
jgi:hypothetical protein